MVRTGAIWIPLDILHSPHNVIVVLLCLSILSLTLIISNKFQIDLEFVIGVPIICCKLDHHN